MKASELVEKLQALIEEHGDLPVEDQYAADINYIEYTEHSDMGYFQLLQ